MQLRAIFGEEFKQLHTLMLQENFPHTPEDFLKAKSFLENCLCLAQFTSKGRMKAAFIFGDITNDTAFLDVICDGKDKGRWLNKKVIRYVMKTAFDDLDLNYVWVQPQNINSYKLASGIGFQIVHDNFEEGGVKLLLTKDMHISSKFNFIKNDK